jgi:DNA-binding beta-propeller fold protein YncE
MSAFSGPRATLLAALLAALLAPLGATPLPAQAVAGATYHYHVARRITVGGEGGWDYLTIDAARHRVFLSHATQVEVVDAESGKVVGRIANTPGVHGIALAQDLARGFVSGGRDSSVTIFDLKTLAPLARVTVPGRNPDAILYDSATHRVFTFNGGSGDATALDARSGTVLGTLPLGGKPEFAVADGQGGVFVNLEDRSELVAFDARTLAVRARWPLAGCEEPSGLAFDRAHGRLFSTCGNATLAVTDARDGHQVTTLPIGEGVDAGAFDPATQLVFASNGAGTLTVVREETPDSFRLVATVPTQRGARTMALDPATHRVFTATAAFGPAPAPTAARPHPRPSIVPGTFTLLVIEP